MSQQSFLIIHGLGGSGPDHWQTWLAQELANQDYHVVYPEFNNFNLPNKKVWLEELAAVIDAITTNQYLTVITHSMGCLLWLHYAANQPKYRADKAILVAPPSPANVIPEAASFFPVPLDQNDLLRAAKETTFVHSTNDPYCSIKDAEQFIRLGQPTVFLENAGHINAVSGHGQWPWILDLCLETKKSSIIA